MVLKRDNGIMEGDVWDLKVFCELITQINGQLINWRGKLVKRKWLTEPKKNFKSIFKEICKK